MKRRNFLIAGALGLATMPLLLRKGFSETPEISEGPSLPETLLKAREVGRPLLVLVVPEDLALRNERGHLFGEWLNFGTDEQLAPLGMCAVMCATMAELRRVLPTVQSGEPLMVLISPALEARVLDAKMPELPSRFSPELKVHWTEDEVDNSRQVEEAQNAFIAKRIAAISGLLASAVNVQGSAGRLARRARARLVEGTPRGARWAKQHACWTEIEGEGSEPPKTHRCGLAFTPARSQRFLEFFADARAN